MAAARARSPSERHKEIEKPGAFVAKASQARDQGHLPSRRFFCRAEAGRAQRLFDADVVARSARPDGLNHVRRQPEADMDLGRPGLRTAALVERNGGVGVLFRRTRLAALLALEGLVAQAATDDVMLPIHERESQASAFLALFAESNSIVATKAVILGLLWSHHLAPAGK